MKRVNNLFNKFIELDNLEKAVETVASGHRWKAGHKRNITAKQMESDPQKYAKIIQQIILDGLEPSPVRTRRRWDKSAGKWRDIAEPRLWPDQVIHHAIIQTIQPILMKGMDYWCCGSIKGRGAKRGKAGIERWIREDKKGTKYCLCADIRHFYDSLSPTVVFELLKKKIKDRRLLDVIWKTIRGGFLIGAYFSQWFANFALNKLDELIRRSDGTSHYVRYMDNFTIFGPNKRKLHRTRKSMQHWLKEHGLDMKNDWQVFRTETRQPQAMGYRYGEKGTRIKKRNALRLKRQLSECRLKKKHHKRIDAKFAAGLLSRLGQLRNCRSAYFYKEYVDRGLQKMLKNIVREEQRKWSMSLTETS